MYTIYRLWSKFACHNVCETTTCHETQLWSNVSLNNWVFYKPLVGENVTWLVPAHLVPWSSKPTALQHYKQQTNRCSCPRPKPHFPAPFPQMFAITGYSVEIAPPPPPPSAFFLPLPSFFSLHFHASVCQSHPCKSHAVSTLHKSSRKLGCIECGSNCIAST